MLYLGNSAHILEELIYERSGLFVGKPEVLFVMLEINLFAIYTCLMKLFEYHYELHNHAEV